MSISPLSNHPVKLLDALRQTKLPGFRICRASSSDPNMWVWASVRFPYLPKLAVEVSIKPLNWTRQLRLTVFRRAFHLSTAVSMHGKYNRPPYLLCTCSDFGFKVAVSPACLPLEAKKCLFSARLFGNCVGVGESGAD